jgi:hypothetical protein
MPPRWARVSPEHRDRLSLSGGMCIEDGELLRNRSEETTTGFTTSPKEFEKSPGGELLPPEDVFPVADAVKQNWCKHRTVPY